MAAVVGESAAETARAMSRRLLHPEGHVSPQEAVTALHLLFAAGAYQEFVDEALLWLGAFDGRFGLPEHSDVFHVLSMCWTLTQGVVEHRNMVKTVGERWGWSPPCDDPAEIEGLVPPFAMRLSPMAALAYNSASRALARMTKEEEGWADAGMVSLGFFRILELEMNRAVFHVQESREPPDGLVRAIQEWLEHNPYDGLSKRQRQSRRQWTFVAESLASALRRANGRPPSMELGPLEALLLRCTKRDDGGSWDAEPRTGLDTFVSAGLTAEGSLALRDGRLAALIRPELRERYRNPPAHSRYLPLRVAVECKAYIDESLGELLQWIDG